MDQTLDDIERRARAWIERDEYMRAVLAVVHGLELPKKAASAMLLDGLTTGRRGREQLRHWLERVMAAQRPTAPPQPTQATLPL